MSATTAKIIADIALRRLRAGTSRLAQWWLAEFHATLPSRFAFGSAGVVRPCLTIAVSDDGHVTGELALSAGMGKIVWNALDFKPDVIGRTLAAHDLRRDEADVKFACDAGLFLQRRMLVPRVALATLPDILAQDILHRTPFEADQIWYVGVPQSAEYRSDVVPVLHWIIRRDRAIAELARCGLGIGDVDALSVRDADTSPTIPFNDRLPEDHCRSGRSIRFLAVAAAVATMLALAAVAITEAITATHIESAMTELRKSNEMLSSGNGVARLYAMRAAPTVVDVWADLSRVFPEDTFLTELRIADGAVTVSGFSANAARLVRLVDQSPMYTSARLTVAITPDATEHKDRFGLAFQLRGSASRNSSAAGAARSEP